MFPFFSNAGNFPKDNPREAYKNWAYCLNIQSYWLEQNKLADDITTSGCKWGKFVTFPNKIVAIALKVGAWEKPEDLFASQDFIAMYKHPTYYWNHVIDYLAQPEHKEKNKQIAIYCLENLDRADYLSFAQYCYKLYQEKKLSESLFTMVLGFEFLRIHPLVLGATGNGSDNDAQISVFLSQIASEVSNNDPIKQIIQSILSDRLANEWSKKVLSHLF